MNMAIIRDNYFNWLFLILLVIGFDYNNAEIETNHLDLNQLNFEQVKNDIFNVNYTEYLSQYGYQDNFRCARELNAVRKGLLQYKMWALKLLDSWAKFPSGILSGNTFELGDFTECLHIERNNEHYKTRYCLAQLTVDLKNTSSTTPPGQFRQFRMRDVNVPNILFTGDGDDEDSSSLGERVGLAPPPSGIAINFGVCMPSACPVYVVERMYNDLLKTVPGLRGKVSAKFPENTCQTEETPSKFRTIDVVSIVILGIVLFLVVACTFYDILFTLQNRNKTQALLAFSFYTNGMKLLSYKKAKSPDMMHCLHGIRAISTQWVVLGHTFMMYLMFPIRNKLVFLEFISKWHNMIILSAPISVDTFFIMSGLLVSINMLKHLEKTKGKLNIFFLYFHRYLRLTPLLIVSILFSMSLLEFLGDGPLWKSTMNINSNCERYWWSTLLYVQNYVNPENICFGHSWYLSVDMQLFIIAPLIIYTIYWLKRYSVPLLSLLVFGCMGCTIAVHTKYQLKGMLTFGKMVKAYYPTHIRFSPWLIGVIGGYILFESRKRRIRIPNALNLVAWAISLALMAGVIFGNYPLQQIDSEASSLDYGLYDAFSRVAWAIALCYIIFACVHGYGGPVNWFLSHPLWQPISRLCYSIYLLHFPVIMVTQATIKTSPYFSELYAYHAFIGNFVLTFFVSIFATLAFESPIVVLEKMLFHPTQTRRPEPNPNDNNQTETEDNNERVKSEVESSRA